MLNDLEDLRFKNNFLSRKFVWITIVIMIYSVLLLSALFPSSMAEVNEGMKLYSEGKYDQSIDWFDNALKNANESDQAPLLNNIGVSYLALNQLDKAKQYFDEALKVNSSYAITWINLGMMNINAENNEEAIQCYDKAIELDESLTPLVLIKKGGLLTAMDKYDEALSTFEEAKPVITEKSDEMALYTGIGAVYYKQENYNAAEEAFNKAIEIDPSTAAIPYYNLGVLKAYEKKFDEAKNALEKAIEIDPIGMQMASKMLEKLNNLIDNTTSSNS